MKAKAKRVVDGIITRVYTSPLVYTIAYTLMSIGVALLMALAALLTGCDGAVIDAFPGAPECLLPAVGDTCREIGVVEAETLIEETAWCLDPEAHLIRSVAPNDIIEYACQPDPVTYRYVVGSYAPGFGLTYLSKMGSLIHCADGEVAAVYPLVTDGERLWHALSAEDLECECWVVSEVCE